MVRQIAVVSQSASLPFAELSLGTAALQRQVTRDLSLHWSLDATVDSFAALTDVPVGYWPIIIEENIQKAGVEGYHTDEHGQPFALVEYSPSWTLAASHEMIEMLVDPYGRTLVPGDSLDPANPGRVQYLVEACDPCEDPTNAYSVNGFLVSEFYTPRYFDFQRSAGVQYSANGKISEPREILPNGYITWHNLVENVWYQATYFGEFQIKNLGQIDTQGKSLRECIDRITYDKSCRHKVPTKSLERKFAQREERSKKASNARAARLNEFMTLLRER